MGGTPISVLNVVGWPKDTFPLETLTEILKGSQDKVIEAGAVVAGGHTCIDRELKFGLAVTGVVHPDKILTNANAKPGDRLILTKPIGMGVITTAIKQGRGTAELAEKVGNIMKTLNKMAAEVMLKYRVHSCTDVTGFGLLGHLYEMMAGSKTRARLKFPLIPIVDEAYDFTGPETVPGGSKANMAYLQPHVTLSGVSDAQSILIHDAQTSGGLIISVDHDDAADLLAELHAAGVSSAAVIGEVLDGDPGKIIVEG